MKHMRLTTQLWAGLFVCLFGGLLSGPVFADELEASLAEVVRYNRQLDERLQELRQALAGSQENQRAAIEAEIKQVEAEAAGVDRDFQALITGGSGLLNQSQENGFDIEQEITSLLKPLFDELKRMTQNVRQKSANRERLEYLQSQVPVYEKALSNIARYKTQYAEDEPVLAALDDAEQRWQSRFDALQNKINTTRLLLEQYTESVPLSSRLSDYLRDFFQKRGFYIGMAVALMALLFVGFRLLHAAVAKIIPGFQRSNRSFRIRLIDLLLRIAAVLVIAISPLAVFYYYEDWLLLSLSLLVGFGVGWSVLKALSQYWRQAQLFLNVGAVREGERVWLDGIPWEVKRINLFTELENPVARLRIRVPMQELQQLRSRPILKDEPWFPCRIDDWVLLNDGQFGKLQVASLEFVTLVPPGGAHLTMNTVDFLNASPMNLSTGYRISSEFGLSYGLQSDMAEAIPKQLAADLREGLTEANFGELLRNLDVELSAAADSSLVLTVLADFSGDAGRHYKKLNRLLQRLCVASSTRHGWEIPFPQMTLHMPAGAPATD